MKKIERLYYCKAEIRTYKDKAITIYQLKSYNTPVVRISQIGLRTNIVIYRYGSMITYQHINKFIKWCKDNIDIYLAQEFERLYRMGMHNYKKLGFKRPPDLFISKNLNTNFIKFENYEEKEKILGHYFVSY